MDPAVGMGIGAVGSLIGGALNMGANNVAQGRAQDVANNNLEMQRQFARYGLQWRAMDAMEAYKETGIHPLSVLGVQGPSYTPVNYVGGANTAMGDAISSAGQNASRAILQTSSDAARLSVIEKMNKMAEEGVGLDNELKRVHIASAKAQLSRQLTSPGFPVGVNNSMPGQGNAPVSNAPGGWWDTVFNTNPARDAVLPDQSHLRNVKGGYNPVPSKAAKELIEDDVFQQAMHFFRSVVSPYWDRSAYVPPAGRRLDSDKVWVYDPVWGYRPGHNVLPRAPGSMTKPGFPDYAPWQNRRHAY